MRTKRVQKRRERAIKPVPPSGLPDPFSELNYDLVQSEQSELHACECCCMCPSCTEPDADDGWGGDDWEEWQRCQEDDREHPWRHLWPTYSRDEWCEPGEDYAAWYRAFPLLPW